MIVVVNDTNILTDMLENVLLPHFKISIKAFKARGS
jgi:hypothetical protein